MGGKVDNGCLSCSKVQTSWYESPRTNQGLLKRTSAIWYITVWQCASKGKMMAHVLIDGTSMQARPILTVVEMVFSPAHSMELSMKCGSACYSLCVDRQGVDSTVVPHIAKWRKSPHTPICDWTYRCVARISDGPMVRRSGSRWWGLQILARCKLNSFN